MEPFYIEDCEKYAVNSKGWYLQGFSKAGDRTGFILYPQKFMFDCGVRTNGCCENIFMTHVHTDHSLELPAICNKHKLRETQKKYNVYVPSTSVKHITLLERCVTQLSFPESETQTDDEILKFQKININPVNCGDTFIIGNYKIQVLESHHTIQAVGYGISSITKKLKPEYLQMMEDESIDKKIRVKQLETFRKSGVEIQETVTTPELAFFCDSSIHNLADHDEWKQYPVIVCECTGLVMNKKTEQDYIDIGHTCITQLLPVIETHIDKKWILIHTSTALKTFEIKQIEADLQSKNLNVIIVG